MKCFPTFFIVAIKALVVFCNKLPKSQVQIQRNRVLARFNHAGGTALTLSFFFSKSATGATASDLREQVAFSAAKIPGFGQPDIFFPTQWEGNWKTKKTVTDAISESNVQIPPFFSRFKKDSSFEYITTFVKYGGNLVVDRAATTKSEQSALSKSNVLVFWTPDNPNILKVNYPDSKSTDIQVTKRSIENDKETGKFLGYSEFARIISQESTLGVPQVFAYRNIFRFKEISENEITALQRTYIYPGDTLDFGGNKPLLTLKMKFDMKKIV